MFNRELTIMHMYPELLNLYGDSGNILVLKKRLEWRGISAKVIEAPLSKKCDLREADIVFIGGGSDREQRIVGEALIKQKCEFQAYAQDGGVLLAVCGGYQLLGHEYSLGEEKLAGLGLIDAITVRESPRLIGNVVAQSKLFKMPIVGYENHGGRTCLAPSVEPLAQVVQGFGNDGTSGYEGARVGNVVGTYIHGPLLPKNPECADWILFQALQRKGYFATLAPLEDTAEILANKAAQKLR